MPNASEIFAASCAPGGIKILGAQLRPVTLGHVVLLSRVGNSLAVGGPESFDDLVSGVLILSRDWREGCRAIDNPPSAFRLRWWQRWCRFANGITTGNFGPLAYAPGQWGKLKEWFAGQLHHDNWPAFASSSGKVGGATSSTPAESFMLVGMMSEFGMTIEECMDTPYTLCRTLLAVNAERRGAGQCFWTDSDEHQQTRDFLKRDFEARNSRLNHN